MKRCLSSIQIFSTKNTPRRGSLKRIEFGGVGWICGLAEDDGFFGRARWVLGDVVVVIGGIEGILGKVGFPWSWCFRETMDLVLFVGSVTWLEHRDPETHKN
jgi:hypothetical protein